ncbi:GHKL domain-containing protein [Cryomorpha ignava]|uniref:histidine kinase n=1 Tax=Cryomorpha ignava TaxID=101383 RepID=A0A7K3WM54_9FLAO|nr:ATP-binding protein [Cryomorpha ignava]NEN22101.1 GHKL domain-containing protein [Cryomorpha ignava]
MKFSLRRSIFIFIAGILLILSARFAADLFNQRIDKIGQSKVFAKELDRKARLAIDVIEDLRHQIRKKGAKRTQLNNDPFFLELYEKEGIVIAVYRNDELALWSYNSISPVSLLRAASNGTEIYKFDNGWYRILYLTNGVDEYCAAILLKNAFPYENSYLDNSFQKDFKQTSLVDISNRSKPGSVKLKADHQSFYLIFDESADMGAVRQLIYILFSILGGLALLVALSSLVLRFVKRIPPWPLFAAYALVVFGLRYISLLAGWPSYITALNLFSPTVYASSAIFPSLIDFCINIVLLLIVASIGRYAIIPNTRKRSLPASIAIFSLLISLLLLYSGWINYIEKGLVLNSNIPFDINNIVGLNLFSFLSIFGSAILYSSLYLLADGAMKFSNRSGIKKEYSILIIVTVTLVSILIQHFMGIRDLIFVLWPPALLLVLSYYRFNRLQSRTNLLKLIFTVVFFAGIASHNFIKYAHSREHAQRQILADKLSVDDDPVAELLYSDLAVHLVKDKGVRRVFEENELHTRETLEDYVLSRYFTGYWGKYNIKMYAFLGDSTTWGKIPAVRPFTFREIEQRIEKYGEPSPMNPQLYYMYNSDDYTTYMAVLPLHYSLSTKPDGFFVFEMSSKLFPQQLGFPSLLIDQSSRANTEAIPYASSRYVGKRLISSRGDYPFQSHPGSFGNVKEGKEYVVKRGYEHLVTRVDHSTIVVLSKPLLSPLDKATTFSYLCVIFGIVLSLGLVIRAMILKRQPLNLNLNQKIQALLIILTLTSLFLFAFATKYYIEQKYSEKNRRQISEKMQSILLEVKSKMGEEESLNYDMSDLLNRMLSQFSYIFFTDINIYSPEGNLLASSQMRMFNEGLLSRKINPEAYAHISYLDEVEYVHEEKIGDLTYISGYTPFYNDRGVLLAYINLPYFAKQTELENEISNFLVSVINIFVLLFLLSILLGLFISQWITAPLRAIRESLAGIELGKTNRLIGYKGSDEIGRLVQEYNIKVAELEHNAEKLAQSERESAWREMAKQVAHEIKNPLTPMKLNIQHLERSIERTGTVDVEQIKRLAANLIEQIDALSTIANAFSNFARMPQATMEEIELAQLLNNAANLYDNFDNVHFINHIPKDADTRIMADRKQLLRVFNNLIKNAIQAVDSIEKGFVEITLKRDSGGFLTEIKDNGSGIKKEDFSKIFVPNFTTKSRGMGLGLAMSKNIVEYSSGKIGFESAEGVGSIFYVWLPEGSDERDSRNVDS